MFGKQYKNDLFVPEGEKPEGIKEKVIKYPGGISREKVFFGKEKKKKKVGVGGTLAGIVFVAWFIMSIVLMVHVFKEPGNADLGLAIFGQVFLVFGIAALCSKQKIGWIFAVVGGALCAGGLYHRFADDPETQTMLVEKVLPVGICSIFPLVGIGMLIHTYKSLIQRKLRCTVPVSAQSTYLDQEIVHVSDGDDGSRPVLMWVTYFRYYYDGKYYYCDCEGVPVSHPKPSLGEYREIHINPNNPEEYWSSASGRFETWLMLIIGSVFTIAGGAALYALVQNI